MTNEESLANWIAGCFPEGSPEWDKAFKSAMRYLPNALRAQREEVIKEVSEKIYAMEWAENKEQYTYWRNLIAWNVKNMDSVHEGQTQTGG